MEAIKQSLNKYTIDGEDRLFMENFSKTYELSSQESQCLKECLIYMKSTISENAIKSFLFDIVAVCIYGKIEGIKIIREYNLEEWKHKDNFEIYIERMNELLKIAFVDDVEPKVTYTNRKYYGSIIKYIEFNTNMLKVETQQNTTPNLSILPNKENERCNSSQV